VLRQPNRLVFNKPPPHQTLPNLIIRPPLKGFNRQLLLVRLKLKPHISRFNKAILKASNMQILQGSFMLKRHLLHRLTIKRLRKELALVFNMLAVLICQLFKLRCRLRGKLRLFKRMALELLRERRVRHRAQMRRHCAPQWALSVRRNRSMVQQQA
jgi:hypothetical protein